MKLLPMRKRSEGCIGPCEVGFARPLANPRLCVPSRVRAMTPGAPESTMASRRGWSAGGLRPELRSSDKVAIAAIPPAIAMTSRAPRASRRRIMRAGDSIRRPFRVGDGGDRYAPVETASNPPQEIESLPRR